MNRAAAMKTLILVHPGSLCGSANFNLGRVEARAVRDAVVADLRAWAGNVLVLDGLFSDELDDYPDLQSAIDEAVARAPVFGRRIDADDPEHADLAVAFLQQQALPADVEVSLTGAWYDPTDASGCVNATRDALAAAGYSRLIVLDSCAALSPYEMGCAPAL